MIVSVLIPSFRRYADLHRCLSAIAQQTRPPDSVIVVARESDEQTVEVANGWRDRLPVTVVRVKKAGQVHSLNSGLAACPADIVAITDDDAAPRQDWLERIVAHFAADPKIGGVGGRDWVHQNGVTHTEKKALVGRVLWYGRVVGNHHLGTGPARKVDILKGANCAFRMAAISSSGFDDRLLGGGAQVHNDMLASLKVKQAGWSLIYDPAVAIDHYPAARFDLDQRNHFNPQATVHRSYNFCLALREITPGWKRVAAQFWHNLVGTRDEPGLLNLLRLMGQRDPNALSKFRAARASSRMETE
jgi:cellulose synthase/poly-beta-1,6-N-acetylglucosamine synthase-like glycosyltransferase